MIFFKLFNKIGYNCFIIFQDYLNIKILKYDENFEILYIFFNFQIFKFFKTFEPPTDGISTPLPMVY